MKYHECGRRTGAIRFRGIYNQSCSVLVFSILSSVIEKQFWLSYPELFSLAFNPGLPKFFLSSLANCFYRLVHELKVNCMQRRKIEIHSPDSSVAGTNNFKIIVVCYEN